MLKSGGSGENGALGVPGSWVPRGGPRAPSTPNVSALFGAVSGWPMSGASLAGSCWPGWVCIWIDSTVALGVDRSSINRVISVARFAIAINMLINVKAMPSRGCSMSVSCWAGDGAIIRRSKK